ncbi:MAG: hypothetical protein K1X75_06475 [Leptospirales bacterium]|nr:hypothetical protein [Leptospirales bacterium]
MDRILALDLGTSQFSAFVFKRHNENRYQLEHNLAATPGLRLLEDGNAVIAPQQALRILCVLLARIRRAGLGPINAAVVAAAMHSYLDCDRDGARPGLASLWLDQRAVSFARRIAGSEEGRQYRRQSGCLPSSTIPYLRLRASAEQCSPKRSWRSLKSWLLLRLGAVDFEDEALAVASGLCLRESRQWSPTLCDEAGLGVAQLPPIVSCQQSLKLTPNAPLRRWLGVEQLLGGGSDGAAAHLGACGNDEDGLSVSAGTSLAVRCSMPRQVLDCWPQLFRYPLNDDRDLLGIAANNGGHAMQSLAQDWKLTELALEQRQQLRPPAEQVLQLCSPFVVGERSFDTAALPAAGLLSAADAALPADIDDLLRWKLILESIVFLLWHLIQQLPATGPLYLSGGVFKHWPCAARWLAALSGRRVLAPDLRRSIGAGALRWPGLECEGGATEDAWLSAQSLSGEEGAALQRRWQRWRRQILRL